MEAVSTSVLIVGGGLVGLSSALLLQARGVATVVVERHRGSSAHPRAIGYTPRTMEILRPSGLAAKIPQAPPGFRLRRIQVESLAGKWSEEAPWTPSEPQKATVEYSPYPGAAIAQDIMEPMLREKARELGADIRLATELVSFEQNAEGVTALVREREGKEYTIRASYMIGADGHRSPVRERLRIGRGGRGHMRTVRSVLFRAPLEEYLSKGISQFSVVQDGFEAFLTTYGDGRWVLIFSDDEERDEPTLRSLVHRAIGRTDLTVEIITTGRWEVSAYIADHFSSGRVFLAGDAAHTLPPSRGGYGANTGIDDAHNLAWKLAAVLSGASKPALLDTYDAERRPIAWLRHNQIFARDDYKAHAAGVAKDDPIRDDVSMEFGQLYRSTSVIGANADLEPALRPEQWKGQPGTRAPHFWINQDEDRSTLDLFGEWVILGADDQWSAEAKKLRLAYVNVNAEFRAALGLDAHSASLIRPDGYIAWRSNDPNALRAALAQVTNSPSA